MARESLGENVLPSIEVAQGHSGVVAGEGRPVEATHQRYVIADPVAFRYVDRTSGEDWS